MLFCLHCFHLLDSLFFPSLLSFSALQDSLNQNFLLVISHREAQRDYSLNFPGSKTIQEVRRGSRTKALTMNDSHRPVQKLSVTHPQALTCIILLRLILISPKHGFPSICQTLLVYLRHRFIIHHKWSHFRPHNYSHSCGPVQPPLFLPLPVYTGSPPPPPSLQTADGEAV